MSWHDMGRWTYDIDFTQVGPVRLIDLPSRGPGTTASRHVPDVEPDRASRSALCGLWLGSAAGTYTETCVAYALLLLIRTELRPGPAGSRTLKSSARSSTEAVKPSALAFGRWTKTMDPSLAVTVSMRSLKNEATTVNHHCEWKSFTNKYLTIHSRVLLFRLKPSL